MPKAKVKGPQQPTSSSARRPRRSSFAPRGRKTAEPPRAHGQGVELGVGRTRGAAPKTSVSRQAPHRWDGGCQVAWGQHRVSAGASDIVPRDPEPRRPARWLPGRRGKRSATKPAGSGPPGYGVPFVFLHPEQAGRTEESVSVTTPWTALWARPSGRARPPCGAVRRRKSRCRRRPARVPATAAPPENLLRARWTLAGGRK